GAAAPNARGGRAVRVAREYHDRTAHSPYSVRASTHSLDWDVKPFPFKVYTDLPPLALPRDIDPLAVDALAAVAAGPSGGVERVAPATSSGTPEPCLRTSWRWVARSGSRRVSTPASSTPTSTARSAWTPSAKPRWSW